MTMPLKVSYTKEPWGSGMTLIKKHESDHSGMPVVSRDTDLCVAHDDMACELILKALQFMGEHVCPVAQHHADGPAWYCRHCQTKHNDKPERCTYCGMKD